MSDAIGEGDWVRCVDAGGLAADYLVEDEVYRVAVIHEELPHLETGPVGTAFELEGIIGPPGPSGVPLAFGAYRFTPLGGDPVAVARHETADA